MLGTVIGAVDGTQKADRLIRKIGIKTNEIKCGCHNPGYIWDFETQKGVDSI